MAKPTKGSIGSYSRGKLEKIIDDRASGLVAGGEANQNAFSNVIVKGIDGTVSGTIAADTATDTLTLVAGDNITMTADTGTDTVTISLDSGFTGGGSTSPGGSDTQIQFNDGGSFGGDSGLTYNKTTDTLSTTRLSASQGIDASGDSTFVDLTATGEVSVSGKLTASNGMAVTNHLSADNGVVTVSGKLTASNGVSVTGNASFDAAAFSSQATFSDQAVFNGTTSLAGTTTASGQLTASNGINITNHLAADNGVVTVSGKLTASNGLAVTGDVSFDDASFSGDVTLGDAATDVTTVTGKLTASNGISVTGDSSLNSATFSQQATFSDQAVFNGVTSLAGTTTASGQLTASNGLLVTNHLSADNGVVTVSGKLTASNGLTVTGDVSFDDASFTGDVTLGNAATDVTTVTGQLTASNGINTTHIATTTISASSAAQIGGTLDVDGTGNFDNSLTVGDGLTVSAGTTAVQALTATTISGSSTLQVGGTADFDGNVTMDKNLTVSGVTTLSGQLTASNGMRISGDVSFGDASFTGDVTLGNGATDVTTVTGHLTASNGANIVGHMLADNGVVTITGQLTASNGINTTAATVTDGLTVSSGATSLQGLAATTISGSSTLHIGGTADFDGNVTMDNNLTVAGTATAMSLTASNGVTITGSLKVKDEVEFASQLSGTTIRASAIYLNDDLLTAGVNTSGNNTWTGTNLFANKFTASNGMMISNHLLADNGVVTVSGQLTASNGLSSTTISASSDLLVGSTIKAENIGTDTDDTVVIQNSDGFLKTREVDTRVWGSTLVDAANGVDNRIATFSDSNSLNGEANLTFDGNFLKLTGTLEVPDSAYFGLMSSSNADINGGQIDGVSIGTNTAIPQLTASSVLVDGDFQVNSSAKISSLAQDLNVNGYNVTNVSQLDVDGNFDFDGDLDADVDNWDVTATTSWSTTLNGSMMDPQAYFKDGDGTTIVAINPLPNPAARGLNLHGATKAYFGINGMNQSGSIGTEDNKTQLIISGTNGVDISGSTNFADDVYIAGTLYGASPLKIGNDVNITGSMELSGALNVTEFANEPPTPVSDTVAVFARTGSLFVKNAQGQTTKVGSGAGGNTNPGGENTYVQFNDGGSFGGDDALVYNKTTNSLTTQKVTASLGLAVTGHMLADGGVVDIATQFTASNGIDVVGHAEMDDVNIAGQFTASNGITVTGSLKVKDEVELASSLSGTVIRATAIFINDDAVSTSGGGGGGSPGGSNTQIQFNDSGAFAGDSGLTYNSTTDTLSVVNLTASNGIQVTGSFKVYGNTEISGGYLGIGVSEEETTHGLTLPNTSGVGGQAKANAFVTYSSMRYKSDIKEIQNPLEKIAQLRGVTYNWKDSGKSDVGLIAEEVGEVMPEIVSFEPNGKDAFGIDYSKLTSLLLASIKAQQDMIETQNKKIEELENKLKKILN